MEEIFYCDTGRGIRVAYTDNRRKNSAVLLFIHGLGNYHGVWKWNIGSLQKKYRCIAIDLPGNGLSSRGDHAYDMNFYTIVVEEFINGLELKHVSLVAHSMGGMIALKAALQKHVTLESLILCAPAGFEYYTPHESMLFKSAIAFGNFLNLDETQIRQSVLSSFYKPGARAKRLIDTLTAYIREHERAPYRAMLERSIHSMLDEPVFKKLKEIHLPTLVFFGKEDMMIPNRFLHPVSTLDIAKKAVKELPDAVLHCYPHTGHFVQIERAEEVNTAIRGFLEERF